MVESMLFDWQSARLQTNYLANLMALQKYLVSEKLLDSVLGFYVIDEPYWKNSSLSNLSDDQVYLNLQTAARELNRIFGNKIIISTEAYPTIDRFGGSVWKGFPPEYNWVAINCYLAFGAACDTEARYRYYVTALYKTMASKPNQKIFFTLDNYWNFADQLNASTQQKLIQRTQFQYNLAIEFKSDALVSFLYQSHAPESLYGLDRMNLLQSFVFNMASSITKKAPACVIKAPTCEGKDYVRRDTCGKEIERWKNAPAPYCRAAAPTRVVTCSSKAPTCEGKDYVRRDTCGKEIERWKNAPKPYCP